MMIASTEKLVTHATNEGAVDRLPDAIISIYLKCCHQLYFTHERFSLNPKVVQIALDISKTNWFRFQYHKE